MGEGEYEEEEILQALAMQEVFPQSVWTLTDLNRFAAGTLSLSLSLSFSFSLSPSPSLSLPLFLCFSLILSPISFYVVVPP